MAVYQLNLVGVPPWIIDRVQSQGLILAADMLEAEANRVAIAGDTANANVLWSMIGRIQATPAWDALAGFQARNTFLTIRAVAHT